MKKTVLLVCFWLFSLFVFSQDVDNKQNIIDSISIGKAYDLAYELYRDGKIDSSLIYLEACIVDKRFFIESKREKARIFRLAAMASYILDRYETGDFYVKKMLAYDPAYQIRQDDLKKFELAYERLYALPKMSLGINFGGNLTMPFANEKEVYSIFEFGSIENNKLSAQKISGEYYEAPHPLVNFGLVIEYSLLRHWALSSELNGILQQFKYSIYYKEQNIGLNEFSYHQSVSYLMMPVVVKYYFFPGLKVRPWIETGFFGKYLLLSRKVSGQVNISNISQMNSFDFGLVAGTGVRYDYDRNGKWGIALHLKYCQGLVNIFNKQNRYYTDNVSDIFLYKNYDVTDNVKLSNFMIYFSWSYFLTYKIYEKRFVNGKLIK